MYKRNTKNVLNNLNFPLKGLIHIPNILKSRFISANPLPQNLHVSNKSDDAAV